MLRNSTNIPNGLVGVAIAHGMSGMLPETPPPDVVEIRNKRGVADRGNWGWWFPKERRIVVYVPREVSGDITDIMRYSKKKMVMRSRAEFLIAVMAHELRHCYQTLHWNTERSKWKLDHDRLGRLAREVDAELWELKKLDEWRIRMNGGMD